MRLLQLMIFLQMWSIAIHAANCDLRLLIHNIDDQNITVEFQAKSPEGIGSGNLVIRFNPLAITAPTLLKHQFPSANFYPPQLTQPYGKSSLSLNIERRENSSGLLFSDDFQTLATVRFQKIKEGEAFNFEWINSVDLPNSSIVFDSYDNEKQEVVSLQIFDVENITPTQLPENFVLLDNYPNPFNPETTIRFYVPENQQLTKLELNVFNSLGAQVRNLVVDYFTGGFHEIRWNSTDNAGNQVASGMYLLVLKTPSGIKTRKLLLVK
ncbi:MAG: T9SS type A sorting domain-containing protein [Calditrichaeota bacterium]|nr:T9SS type A sorting domain-containing protein [Calditrichota bacterium]